MSKNRWLVFFGVTMLTAVFFASWAFANADANTVGERIEALVPVNQSVCVIVYLMPYYGPGEEEKLFVTLERESSQGTQVIVDDHYFDKSEAVKGDSFFAVPDLCTPTGELKYGFFLRGEDEASKSHWGFEKIEMPSSDEPCTDTEAICDEAIEIWEAQNNSDDSDDESEDSSCGCTMSGKGDKGIPNILTIVLVLTALVALRRHGRKVV